MRSRACALVVLLCAAGACSSTSRSVSDVGRERSSGRDTAAASREQASVTTGRRGVNRARGSAGASMDDDGESFGGSGSGSASVAPSGGSVGLGVRYIDARSVQTAGEVFGLSGADIGDPRAYADALIKALNAQGGLLGHRIVPTYYAVDAVELATNSTAAEEKACVALAEDADVFAVVSPGPTNQAFTDCTSKRKLPVVNASYNYFTPSLLRTYGPYFYFPVGPNASRSANAFIAGIKAQGFFAKGYKLGLVRLGSEVHNNVLAEAIKPALKAHGLQLHEDYALRNALDSSGYSAAVLRFKSAGVTNVIFIESAGQIALGFTEQAENQGYRPRYGFSSHGSMFAIAANTPPEQLERSVGIGWLRASDATGPKGVELDGTGEACLRTIRASGAKVDTNGALTVALWTCDTFRFLDLITERGGELSAAGLSRGAGRLGDVFRPASTFATTFPGGRHDGVSMTRWFAYATPCKCFRWSGAPYEVP